MLKPQPKPQRRETSDRMKEIRDMCAARQLELTPLRLEVLEILIDQSGPVGAYAILDQMAKARNSSVAPPTVYRTLDFLVENGLAIKVESHNAYAACEHPGHAHHGILLICGTCGKSQEVESPEIGEMLRATAQASGFRAEREVIEIEGQCQQCIEAA